MLEDVRVACERSGRPAEEGEIRRALETLSSDELEALERIVRSPMAARPLGPDALVDIVRGVPPAKAAARELGGYYELKAERDALAHIARQGLPPEPAPEPEEAAPPVPEEPEAPARSRRRAGTARPESDQESQALMTLFAYHRDAVRVAQELAVGLTELNERIEALGLRRRIHRLLESTTDIDAFRPELMSSPTTGSPVPVVRRKSDRPVAVEPELVEPPEPEPPEETGPATNTTPVTPFGTRVYRRVPQSAAPPPPEPTSGLAVRREYVRETRRRKKTAKVATPARPVEVPKEPAKRPFVELQAPGGAAVLTRLLADEKANPRVLATKLGERFDGPANRPLDETDLRALLQHHGLADTFREREIANARFLIGFHQGARGKLANALLMTPEDLSAYLSRIGLAEELEKTRAERRASSSGVGGSTTGWCRC